MTAVEVLEELRRLGVAVEARGDRILCTPGSAVPLSLAGELRRHKARILGHLREQTEHPKVPEPTLRRIAAQRELVRRLRAGVKWLTEAHERLYRLPGCGVGSKLEREFLERLDGWDAAEKQLRELFGYRGCIFSPARHPSTGSGRGCPDGAPVACRYCGETNAPHWTGG